MKFLLSLLAFVTAKVAIASPAAIPATIQKRATTCSDPAFVAIEFVGTNNHPYCESNWGATFLPVSSLTVWSGDTYVYGLQATYADGSVGPMRGSTAGNKKSAITINYLSGERFTAINIWGVNAIRHIRFTTNKGQTFNAGEAVSSLNYEQIPRHDQAVGTGIMMGFQGSDPDSGKNNNGLGFVMLGSAVASIKVSNLQFPNGPFGSDGISIDSLDQKHYWNGGNQATTWEFSGSKQYTVAKTFTSQFTLTFSDAESTSISGMIPMIGIGGSSTSTFTWTSAFQTVNTRTTTTQRTVSWKTDGSLAPKTGITATAIDGLGGGDYPYTSTVTFVLKNGNQYTFQENGSLKFNEVSLSNIGIEEADHP